MVVFFGRRFMAVARLRYKKDEFRFYRRLPGLTRCLPSGTILEVYPVELRRIYWLKEDEMASTRQRTAAKKNIRKAAAAAKKTRTIAHLPKAVRTALGKQAAKVAKQKRRRSK